MNAKIEIKVECILNQIGLLRQDGCFNISVLL